MTGEEPFEDAGVLDGAGAAADDVAAAGDTAYRVATGVARVARAGAYVTGGALVAANGGGVPAQPSESRLDSWQTGWAHNSDPDPNAPSPVITFPDVVEPDPLPDPHAPSTMVNGPAPQSGLPELTLRVPGYGGNGGTDAFVPGAPAPDLPVPPPVPVPSPQPHGFLPQESPMPGGNLPQLPHLPELPQAPELPDVGNGMRWPGADGPGIPGLPQVPDLPSVPGMRTDTTQLVSNSHELGPDHVESSFGGAPGGTAGFGGAHDFGSPTSGGFGSPAAHDISAPGPVVEPGSVAPPSDPFDGVGAGGDHLGLFVGTEWNVDFSVGPQGVQFSSEMKVDIGAGRVGDQLDDFTDYLADGTRPPDGIGLDGSRAGAESPQGAPGSLGASGTPGHSVSPTAPGTSGSVPGLSGAPMSPAAVPPPAPVAPAPVVSAPMAPAPVAPVPVPPAPAPVPVVQATPLQTTIQPEAASHPIAGVMGAPEGPSVLTVPAAGLPAVWDHAVRPAHGKPKPGNDSDDSSDGSSAATSSTPTPSGTPSPTTSGEHSTSTGSTTTDHSGTKTSGATSTTESSGTSHAHPGAGDGTTTSHGSQSTTSTTDAPTSTSGSDATSTTAESGNGGADATDDGSNSDDSDDVDGSGDSDGWDDPVTTTVDTSPSDGEYTTEPTGDSSAEVPSGVDEVTTSPGNGAGSDYDVPSGDGATEPTWSVPEQGSAVDTQPHGQGQPTVVHPSTVPGHGTPHAIDAPFPLVQTASDHPLPLFGQPGDTTVFAMHSWSLFPGHNPVHGLDTDAHQSGHNGLDIVIT